MSNWRRDVGITMALALRYFAGQHPKAIARETGVTDRKLQSFFYYIELPQNGSRPACSEGFDEQLGRANLAKSGFELATCEATGLLFFRRVEDRARVTVCRSVRIARRLSACTESRSHAPFAPASPNVTDD